MSRLKITSLTSFILLHLMLLYAFVGEYSDHEITSFIGVVFWILGVITAVSNILFAEKVLTKWWLVVFSICSILWVFPPLIISYPGMIMGLGFFIIGIVVHCIGLIKF